MKDIDRTLFISNYRNYFSAQRMLEIAINICIDIGSHIISLDEEQNPETYSDIMDALMKKEIISAELKENLIKMVRFRNLLDNYIIFDIIQNNLEDFND